MSWVYPIVLGVSNCPGCIQLSWVYLNCPGCISSWLVCIVAILWVLVVPYVCIAVLAELCMCVAGVTLAYNIRKLGIHHMEELQQLSKKLLAAKKEAFLKSLLSREGKCWSEIYRYVKRRKWNRENNVLQIVWENILQTTYNTFLLSVLPFVHVVF